MQTLIRPNAAQFRARQMSQRFSARTMPIPARLSAQTELAIESLAIDEAGREIGISGDTMRYENEIVFLRSQLANADLLSAARRYDLREQLAEAERDLALARWEAMQ